ncbi:hypothetical protein [Yoonia sp. 2307UL14-13]|uniref:hypothetical protein n=1 Tax=Yoonia sp. 2307UL14-13 TaxID=3126506 RepID=UPI0030AAF884
MNDITLLTSPTRDRQTIEATYLDAIVRDDVFAAGAFQMALPKLWTVDTFGADNMPSGEKPVIELARARPGVPDAFGATHDAIVQVWSAKLPRVMNGSDWLWRWAATQGYVIHALRELPTKNGIMGDAVLTSEKTGRLHRMVTMKDGDLIFLVDGSVDPRGAPQDPNLQEIALLAAMRFKLLSPSGTRYAEPMSEETVTSTLGQIGFFLPQSWNRQTAGEAPEQGAVSSYVTKLGDAVAGTLVVALGGYDTTAQQLEDTLIAKLENQGQNFGPATKTLEADKQGYRFSTWRREGTVSGQGDVQLLTMRGSFDGLPVSIAMLTAVPQTAFESYAVNRRVFEIVVESHAIGLL